MRVLLVSPNRETEPYAAAPLGLGYLASALEAEGHEVRLVDLCFEADPEGAVDRALEGFRPRLIGISFRNLESSTLFVIPTFRPLVRRLQAQPGATLVAGGAAFTIAPEPMLRYLGLRWGIVGEGESAIAAFARAIDAGEEPRGIPGLARLRDGHFRLEPPRWIEDLDRLRAPSRANLDPSSYEIANVQTKRGCALSCIYCTYPVIEGRRLRVRSPAAVVDEIEALASAGVTSIDIVDNLFTGPVEHALAICREISARRLPVQWAAFVSPEHLTADLVDAMVAAGCTSLELSTDSASDRVLARLGKRFRAADVRRAAKLCDEAGLLHLHFVLFGGPGEDEASLAETIATLEEVSPPKVFAVAAPRIYPGTPLAALALHEGQVQPGDDLFFPRFYVSPLIGEKVFEMGEAFGRAHPEWVYYPAPGVRVPEETEISETSAGTAPVPLPEEPIWTPKATSDLQEILDSVPRLLRPIARKAVLKKAAALAREKAEREIGSDALVAAFVTETPRPFQKKMREKIRAMGLAAHLGES